MENSESKPYVAVAGKRYCYNYKRGKCAVCDIHQSEHEHALVVDHDHITKEVRGLLCHKCNRGLGLFDDNLEKMAQAIKYLKKAKKCQL